MQRLGSIARSKEIKDSKEIVTWDGYQKEVSVKKKLKVVPAYADQHDEVEVLNADGQRLRKMSRKTKRNTRRNVRNTRSGRSKSHNNQDQNDEKKKRSAAMERVQYSSNPMFYMLHLISVVQVFAKHQFINIWQHSARSGVWDEFPKDAVLIEMDFAENFTIIVQDQQQAGHWVHKQDIHYPHNP